ncbi:hypothetical protein RRG08_022045 [Elysia crispata]|uniref:Uncharacterized protein n=1 Tax=Elysia crispata TaxID=231223 RepID=A0AAE0YYX3_9GAST|nr:hypothetical protein RRG08_022045 [Elysia crispata]
MTLCGKMSGGAAFNRPGIALMTGLSLSPGDSLVERRGQGKGVRLGVGVAEVGKLSERKGIADVGTSQPQHFSVKEFASKPNPNIPKFQVLTPNDSLLCKSSQHCARPSGLPMFAVCSIKVKEGGVFDPEGVMGSHC